MNDIVISHLFKAFGDKKILTDFSATLPAGKTTVIMGPSGCGKTTLVNILLGITRPDGGSVVGLPEKISAVFQEDRLCQSFTPLSNVRMVLHGKNATERAREILISLGLESCLTVPCHTLSGGMKRRVAIARALAAEYDLIVMDEPFKGLDKDTKQKIVAYIRKQTEGKTLLIVSHDESDAAAFGGDVLRLSPSDPTE